MQPVYATRTDRGQRRERNEDFLHAGPVYVEGASDGAPAWYLLAVADGVGGRQRGEWASRLAVATLADSLPAWLGQMEPLAALRQVFRVANDGLWQAAARDASVRGAATTLVAVLVGRGLAWWAHVGDSRAYLVRAGQVARLTRDHSWVQEQVQAGLMTRAEAQASEHRHVITRSIGGDAAVEVDTGGPLRLEPEDSLVLCSDGLYEQVADDELAQVVAQFQPPQAAERLVRLSNARGGPDNISVIVCRLRTFADHDSDATTIAPLFSTEQSS